MDHADPRSLILLVGQHPFNFYIASNFVMSVALNSICRGLIDAYLNSIVVVVSKTPFKFQVVVVSQCPSKLYMRRHGCNAYPCEVRIHQNGELVLADMCQ